MFLSLPLFFETFNIPQKSDICNLEASKVHRGMSLAESPTWWLTKPAACRKPDLYVAERGTKLEQQVISRVPKAL